MTDKFSSQQENLPKLEKNEKRNKKIAVFFDIDDTLIKGQTQKLMVSYFYHKRKINSLFLLEIYFWFLLYT